jgi:Tol biopolymer transport system component
MNVKETKKRLIVHWLINQHYLVNLFVVIMLLCLAACSNSDPVVIDININDQIAETEIYPTPESTQSAYFVPNPLAGRAGKIAFWTDRDGNGEIYLMGADGRNQINLTNNDALEIYPAWSPDGSKIVFISSRTSKYESTGTYDYEIYVMNADGSNQIRLTDNDQREGYPAWSPDGSKIAFVSDWDGIKDWSGLEICVMDADGSNVIRLTNNDSRDDLPAWSPDGSKIAFTSDRDGDREIYVMDADGSNVIRLTEDDSRDISPVWSPDGSKIAFSSDRDGNAKICVMDADGSNVICLPNIYPFTHASFPAWSPDGSKIAFSTQYDIYVMNADGSELERLVAGPGMNVFPIWQP